MAKRARKTAGIPIVAAGQMVRQPQLPQPAYALASSSNTVEKSPGIMERPTGMSCGVCGAAGDHHSAMSCLIATCPFKWD